MSKLADELTGVYRPGNSALPPIEVFAFGPKYVIKHGSGELTGPVYTGLKLTRFLALHGYKQVTEKGAVA